MKVTQIIQVHCGNVCEILNVKRSAYMVTAKIVLKCVDFMRTILCAVEYNEQYRVSTAQSHGVLTS